MSVTSKVCQNIIITFAEILGRVSDFDLFNTYNTAIQIQLIVQIVDIKILKWCCVWCYLLAIFPPINWYWSIRRLLLLCYDALNSSDHKGKIWFDLAKSTMPTSSYLNGIILSSLFLALKYLLVDFWREIFIIWTILCEIIIILINYKR